MSQTDIDKLEQRFNALENDWTQEQWQDADYLREEALNLEDSDLELAYRLMQRAHNIRPAGPVIKNKLQEYRQRLMEEGSPILILSSTEDPIQTSEQEKRVTTEAPKISGHQKIWHWLRQPFAAFVILPWIAIAIYFLLWASPRYESHAQVIIRKPNTQLAGDASSPLLGNRAANSAGDTQLISAFILSRDMLNHLQSELSLFEHYTSNQRDMISRLSGTASNDQFLSYFQRHIVVDVDEASSVVSIKSQAYSGAYAQQLNQQIIAKSEDYINSIGQSLARKRLTFIEAEHRLIEDRLRKAKTDLLRFQQKYRLFDPQQEAQAVQQIAFKLEEVLSDKKTQLLALREYMQDSSPKIRSLQREINALEKQLVSEKQRLISQKGQQDISFGEVLARYSAFQIKVDLAMQAYTSSLVSLERSRIEAYRQLQYMVVVESPTLPEDNSYPDKFYNLSLAAVVLIMLFGIGKILIATIRELE
ncbi:lipopolysaccharide biosynthesis protein [Thalassotalea litorea]|uniref:Lipopolysaccharide biosynthesis protein n=1 Tax=Thalassotalea litorea TaxID=2020715 RepID=A0A5R9IQ72_9GAMM|nr:lipopolysaccharide biosynthesis protein [Thalassotalea litorea]TLU67685.1 lipopolysaccharide biosynthesis protein [Thalassotalea litorea]